MIHRNGNWDKTYRVYMVFEQRGRAGQEYEADTLKVEVTDGRQVYDLKQIVHHSPTGMMCGYGGSGPADLALTILADHFEEGPRKVLAALEHGFHRSKAAQTYHFFKSNSPIASMKMKERSSDNDPEHLEEWTITQAEIREILRDFEFAEGTSA